MIEIYESAFENENKEIDIKAIIHQICDLIDFDIGLVLMFDNHKKIAQVNNLYIKDNIDIVDKVLIKKFLSEHEFNKAVKLAINKNNFLTIDYTLSDKNGSEEYTSLLKAAKKEIYIPLTIGTDWFLDSFSCIYLCSYDAKVEIMPNKLDYGALFQKVVEISSHLRRITIKEKKMNFLLNISHFFSELVSIKDISILNHSFNVAYFSMMLAEKMQFNSDEKQKLYYASLLHDIGKIYIDDLILKKDGKLTNDELNELKKHSFFGYSITRGIFCDINKFEDIPIIIKHHHERMDGNGYPDQLKGEEIPFYSRLIYVADSVDSMLSKRSYKENMGINYVISELVKNKDKQFDGRIVKAALDVLNSPMRFNQFNFLDSIMWCAIIVHLKSTFKIIQGSLTKMNCFYKFRYFSTLDKDAPELKEVTKVDLFIPTNMNVNEYDTEVICITEDCAYFSELKDKRNTDSFSILWELKGVVISSKTNTEINIYKIGGANLSFCVQDIRIEKDLESSLITIRIIFEDKTYIDVTGNVYRTLKIGSNIYCEFRYTNLLESTRDKIFAQIFMRQRQLRKI